MHRDRRPALVRATWPIPILIALATIAGLIAALAGDGWHDLPAWLALAAPLVALAWARRGRR
ncbi:hypothetical protein F1C10_13505 [Sphingomonas sp. NBWT7]|uniref:hypothetical protein n=1 Tax=Sphingomonas sp. NBWT7 TaxID=2596913 RepID=UPI00162ADF04|nr:hypothetical protein [Sphingomonas sp. NBWT7]QNE33520.1 hypothetical protein F1C10_13505 [Sphingomonas sp. NBWT7]